MFVLGKIANDDQVERFLGAGHRRQAALGVRDDRTRRRRFRPGPAGYRGGVLTAAST